MNNKLGFLLGLLSAFLYSVFVYGLDSNYWIDLLAYLLGTLIFIALIAGLISVFTKGKNFGKIFGITSVIMCIIAAFGNLTV